MVLKEAFRYQNYLNILARKCSYFLSNDSNVTVITETHLRTSANPDAENEVIEIRNEDSISANDVINFIEILVKEKEAITSAISKTKKNLEYDIDSMLNNNKFREDIISILGNISEIKSSESKGSGLDYKFNVNGEQAPYRYTVNKVTTIDFDRNKVKSLYNKYNKLNDENSNTVDRLDVTAEVEFTPKFDINDSFEDAIESVRSEL